MAAYENVREVSAVVQVTNGTPEVQKFRFAKWKQGGADQQVTAANNGDPVAGVISQKVPTGGAGGNTFMSPAVSMAIPDAGICLVELGEAVTDLGVGLRPATDGSGKAFLADAAGDQQVGVPLELGAVGQIIRFQFKAAPALHA